MTEEQLMLLEQITYIKGRVYEEAGLKNPGVGNMKEMLDVFTEDALKKLEQAGDISYTDGSEWAAIIRAIKTDPDLMRLDLSAYSEEQRIYCFEDPERSGEAIVAFRGTVNGQEWKDNVEGLNVSDTPAQKKALDFVENLPYDNITVVGHSKGGNKAQYVAMLSDKVTKCLSMDGQGFSRKFLDKYWAEIQAKSGMIQNYSLSDDFVNILMFYTPGADQKYFQGENAKGFKNHSPSSYFQYYQDAEGNWQLKKNNAGHANLIGTEQNEMFVYLHQFTCFVMNEMPESDQKVVVEYLGNLLAVAMDGNHSIEINGIKYRKNPGPGEKGIMDLIATDTDTAAVIIAYLAKYIDTYDLKEDQVYMILDAFGLGDKVRGLEDMCNVVGDGALYLLSGGKMKEKITNAGGIVMFLFHALVDQASDGEEDPLLRTLLSWLLEDKLSGWLGKDVDVGELWEKIGAEIEEIGPVDAATANQDGTIRTGKLWDFSAEAYNALTETIATIERMTFGSVSGWTANQGEDWYGALSVGAAVYGITKYYEKLSEINEDCKSQIDTIFTNVWDIDVAIGEKIQGYTTDVEEIKNKLLEYALTLTM